MRKRFVATFAAMAVGASMVLAGGSASAAPTPPMPKSGQIGQKAPEGERVQNAPGKGALMKNMPPEPEVPLVMPKGAPSKDLRVGSNKPIKGSAKEKHYEEANRRKVLPPGRDSGPTTFSTTCPTPVSGCYEYAGTIMGPFTDNPDGLAATMTISDPFNREQCGAHTLTEINLGNSGNTVELGWRKDCGYPTDEPYLFAYAFKSGAGLGYDQTSGYLDVSGCNPCAGDSLTAYKNTSRTFGVQYFDDGAGGITDGWWASFNGNYIGVWPKTLWTNTGVTFVEGDRTDAYGEIASGDLDDTCTDMGSGAQGGAAASTDISSITLIGSTDAENFDANLYDNADNAWESTGISDTRVRTGGAGYNSVGLAQAGYVGVPGAIGSCAPASEGTPAASSLQSWREICPDGAANTGCNSGGSWNTGTAPLNTCVNVTGPYHNALWNNSGVSGRSYLLYKTSACSGSSITITNASKLKLTGGYENGGLHGIKRVG